MRAIPARAAPVDAQRSDRLAGHRLDRPAVQLGDPTGRNDACIHQS